MRCVTRYWISLDNIQLQLIIKDGYPAVHFQLLDDTEQVHPAPPVNDEQNSTAASTSVRQDAHSLLRRATPASN